jgi:putative acyl-CoA dehydrogenase
LLPRLYRESPVNAIWEGSGNVMCLDVLRALKRDDEMALIAALAHDAGIAASDIQAPNESDARSFVERLAILASVSALRASAPARIADAFLKTRLINRHGAIYGASNLDESTVELLLQRVLPEA